MLDGMLTLAPWLPPIHPDLATLAMAAADAAGVAQLRAWPEAHGGGIRFGDLPTFLCWRGDLEGRHHLLLFQPREVGALVPGARPAHLPEGWLDALDLDALARPLAGHPDFPGGASIHVAHLPGGPVARVRTHGGAAPQFVDAVLSRTSHLQGWTVLP